MDIVIKKKKSLKVKRYLLLFMSCLLLLFAGRYLWLYAQADLLVERDSIVISQVTQGKFTVKVRGGGVLVPDQVQWLSTEVEANVVSLMVKAGNEVKSGDVIVELSNPRLEQEMAEVRWQLEAEEAELNAARIEQEAALLQQEATILNAKLEYESRLLDFMAQDELITINSAGAAPKIAFKKTGLETDLYKQRWQISQKQSAKMKENLQAQDKARAARLNRTKKRLERLEEQVRNLNIRATMDSVVLEMPLELGQRIVSGTNIAKLARQDSLIAELQIPEIQIRDVAVGQRVIIDTRNSKINGFVTRVDPAVVNGNVQVDVAFSESLPSDARAELSVDGEILVAEIEDTLFVSRPLFAQSESRSSFYKLSQDGQFASRVEVGVGIGSVNQIQILEGLRAGDRIITSDTTRFETKNKIQIQ